MQSQQKHWVLTELESMYVIEYLDGFDIRISNIHMDDCVFESTAAQSIEDAVIQLLYNICHALSEQMSHMTDKIEDLNKYTTSIMLLK